MKLDYSFLNGQTKTEYSEFNHVIEHMEQEDLIKKNTSNDIVHLSVIGRNWHQFVDPPNVELTSRNIMIKFDIEKDLDAIRKEHANVLNVHNCNILETQEVESSYPDRNQYILYVRAVQPGKCGIIASDPRNEFKETGRVDWEYTIGIGSGILSENPQSIFGLNLEMFKEDKQGFSGFYGNNEISRKKMFISVPPSKEEF